MLTNQMQLGFALTFLISFNVYAENIKITLLGTGTPVPSIERFGPSTLVEAGTEKLLFDVGRGTTQRLWQLAIPLRAITNVFFTHYHSDHTVGLPDLWLSGWLPAAFGQRTTALPVWGPSGIKELTTNLENAYQADIRMRMEDEKLLPAGASFLVKEIS
jgi:ribonuclease Z